MLSIPHSDHAEGFVSLREFNYLEHERVKSRGLLASLEVKPPSTWRTVLVCMWVVVALTVGLFLLALIFIGHLIAQ